MEIRRSVNFRGFGYRAMQGIRLIEQSMAFATTFVSPTLLLREAAGGCLKKKNRYI
jgi:hypothetical protein